jgi:hypothetical protein
MSNARTRFFWGVLSLTLIGLISVAYLVHGGLHGLYADDYVYKYGALDLATGAWKPDWNLVLPRTLNYVVVSNFAVALPGYELPVRLGIVVLLALDAILLGALAFRLTSSQLIALLSAAFFLVPVFAAEAVLWFTGAVIYLSSLLFLLIGFHLILSGSSPRKQFLALIGAIAAWCAMVLFIESGFFVVLLVPFLVWLRDEGGTRSRFKPALIAVAVTYILFVSYAFIALRNAPVVGVHGANTFDPVYIVLHRIPDTFNGLADYVRDWEPGGMYQEALNLGAREWLSSQAGWIIVGLDLVGVMLTAAFYPLSSAKTTSGERGLKLFLLGIAWIGLALAPTLFFVDLQISSRVLLFPSAGFAVGLAGLLGWLVDRFRRRRVLAARVLVLLTGLSVLLCSLAMAGLVVVNQLRWERDREEVTALRTAVPAFPDSYVWVMPVGLDDRIVGPYLGHPTVLDQYTYGLFHVPWAAEPALKMEYADGQLGVIDQATVSLTGVSYTTNGEIDAFTFEGDGQTQKVPTNRLLAFTYLRNRVILFNHVTITMPDGAKSEVELVLPSQVAAPETRTRTMTLKLEGDSP